MKKLLLYCMLAALCPFGRLPAQTLPQLQGLIQHAGTGQPIGGATIAIKGSQQATSSNEAGRFTLQQLNAHAILIISNMGFQTQEVAVQGRSMITITLVESASELDQAVVTGYGSTTKRYNTGNVGRVSAAAISRMPITNPLQALQGRVAGLSISPTNGLPGSTFNVLIRGKSSLSSGTQPLYVVDGVPFMQNRSGNTLLTAMAPSPLNSINPTDIESIEVLKDADATAIYGSQGANGVILITTRKAAAGATRFDVNYFAGFGQVARQLEPLSGSAYLAMRRAAFAADGSSPTVSTAPDLLLWDTTRFTNWQEQFTGGTARQHNLQASLSGGNAATRFMLSGNYNGQTTVFPQSQPTQRGGGYLTVSHQPAGGRLKAQLNTAYSVFDINSPVADLSAAAWLPPNAPALYDSTGKLNWAGWNGIDNPMAQLARRYRSHVYTLNMHLVLEYRLLPGLWLKASGGYNQQRQDEYRSSPISGKRPASTTRGEADWQQGYLKNWIIEPQADYRHAFGPLKMELTAGLSLQRRRQEAMGTSGSQYTDDDLLGNPLSAGRVTVAYSSNDYRYSAVFGRISFRYKDRLLLNLNGRRDGSSRFGPASRFANFGAVGAGWIFSEESIIKNHLPFISYGKLRGSIGVTGNDQIGDYAWLDSWSSPTSGPYQGSVALSPTRLYNPYLRWEKTRKLEAGLELGFFSNRIMANLSWYQHRGSNQLTGYALPSQTGFTSISSNLGAVLENKGWELELTTENTKGALRWQTMLNLTLPKSRLVSYPKLESSAFRYTYAIDQPLELMFGYSYKGIDPQTGLYSFEDTDKNGVINVSDYTPVGSIRQQWYGGLQNLLEYKGWQLEVFIQLVKQTGRGWAATLSTVPGNLGNIPTLLQEGLLQKLTAANAGAATTAYRNYQLSGGMLTNASFARLKNLSLSYNLPAGWLAHVKMRQLRLYVQGQNLLTITGYKGGDPETQSLLALPPLRMAVVGAAIGF